MTDWDVFRIHRTAGRIIVAAAEKNRLPQAYLFYGVEGVGKWAAAVRTAQLMMCPEAADLSHTECAVCRRIADYGHPDVHWLPPLVARDRQRLDGDQDDDRASSAQHTELQGIFDVKRKDQWAALEYPRRPYLTIGRVRALQVELSRTAVEGRRKVGILTNVETMRPDAQSVLLKTIEEPPPETFLILTVTDKSALLSTILSRCQPVRFGPLPNELILTRLCREYDVDPARARDAVALSGGGWTRAARLLDEQWDAWREAAEMILTFAAQGRVDNLIGTIDTILKGRPPADKVLFMFDVWEQFLHRAALTLGDQKQGAVGRPLQGIFTCRTILDDARTAIVGNVTSRTAIAAAFLQISDILIDTDVGQIVAPRPATSS